MVDLEILKDHGLTPELLEKRFSIPLVPRTAPEGTPTSELNQDEKIQKLRNRIRHRISAGRNDNIARHRLFHALDLAWDTPFRQISPTLLQTFIDKDPSSEEVLSQMKSWGFDPNNLVEEIDDPKTPSKKIKRFNIPVFCNVFVPLCRAYGTIRCAKIMNDRLASPMYRYEPAVNTAKNRVQCDVITNRVDAMNRDYGYWSVLKQCVFQMLHYSVCLKFPVEEWHKEEQLVVDDDVPVEKMTRTKDGLDEMLDRTGGLLGGTNANPDQVGGAEAVPAETPSPAVPEATGEAAIDAALADLQEPEAKKKLKTRVKVVKEGLRYHMPHPSRMFYDQAHRLSTFNTDSGCEFGGYWRVFRYRDIRDNPDFWNKERISIGDTGWWANAGTFWNVIFSGSVIKNPSDITASLMSSSKDRETKMLYDFYTQDYDDASVVITEYFEKMVPKEFGLGTYPYPVWFRFVVGGDDTILYAAPLPYVPITAYVYDADEARSQNASLTLEVLPFQDQISNLLTQSILTAKANLSNITFVDEDVVDKKWFDTLRNYGEKLFRVRNFAPFSGKKLQKQQNGVPNLLYSHNFPAMDTNGIIQCIRLVLDMLERVLVMSSQEVAQAAAHELREKEVENISGSTSTRLQFTTAPVDLACEAEKKQLYEGLMAYGDSEMYSEVQNDPMITPQMLEKMGFTFEDDGTPKEYHAQTKIRVKHRKTALRYASFTISRDGNNPTSKDAIMQMANAFSGWLANPILGPAIGPDQAISMANMIARMAGFPREFKLQNASGNQALEAMLKKFMAEVKQEIQMDIQKGLKPMMDLDLQQQRDIEQMKQMLQIPPQPPSPAQYDSAPQPSPDGPGNIPSPEAAQAISG